MIALPINLPIVQTLTTQVDGQESVEAGREALDRWWDFPWYDAQTDSVRRVDVPEPWDFSWLWDRLPEWDLSWLWDWLSPLGALFQWPSTLLGWIAWIMVVLLLGALMYLLIRAHGKRQLDRAGAAAAASDTDENDAARIEALPTLVPTDQLDLLGEARRLYRAGHYGRAVVYLFSFQLVRLDKQQIIHLRKGKTNRQYLREIGRRTPLRRLVEQSMVAFEDVFFGHRTLQKARFEACWSRLDEFELLTQEGATG